MTDKFGANFRLVGHCDPAPWQALLANMQEDEWNRVAWRQERFGIHKYTQTIELIFDTDFRHENPTRQEPYDRLGCGPLLAPIEKTLREYFTGKGYIVRALLVNLKAGGVIKPHEDTGYSLMASCRVHIPIISNDRVRFTIGGEPKVMKEGEMWEVNNARVHGVENAGEADRVHLIIDWVATL